MGRPLRDTTPGKVHLITCRTLGAEILFVPREELNEIVGGVFAYYLAQHDVTLYGLTVLGNHYHLLAEAAEPGALSLFLENVNREIARRVNFYTDRQGYFWGRRYDDQVTVETMDALNALVYLTTNPVKHGLARHPTLWPGVSTYHQLFGAKPVLYAFTNYSAFYEAKRRAAPGEVVRLRDFESRNPLKIAPLPVLAKLSKAERHAKLQSLIEERTTELKNERIKAGKGFIPRKELLAMPKKGCFPKEVSRSARPRCYSANPEAIKQFKAAENSLRSLYRAASIRYRSGERDVRFPPNTFLPPCHRIPKAEARAPS